MPLPPSALAPPVEDAVWREVRAEAEAMSAEEMMLQQKAYLILSARSLEVACASIVGDALAKKGLPAEALSQLIAKTLETESAVGVDGKAEQLGSLMRRDLVAIHTRDPACPSKCHALLFFKGFAAIQAHRVGHQLWNSGRHALASLLQSRISEVYGVDVHPAAVIGGGAMIDHATGVVIGETSQIGDDVTLLHGVTLGGTGKNHGDRHPKLANRVTVGAGATILGNIKIGEGATIAACSVVLKPVPQFATVVGSPAKIVSQREVKKLHLPTGFAADGEAHVASFQRGMVELAEAQAPAPADDDDPAPRTVARSRL